MAVFGSLSNLVRAATPVVGGAMAGAQAAEQERYRRAQIAAEQRRRDEMVANDTARYNDEIQWRRDQASAPKAPQSLMDLYQQGGPKAVQDYMAAQRPPEAAPQPYDPNTDPTILRAEAMRKRGLGPDARAAAPDTTPPTAKTLPDITANRILEMIDLIGEADRGLALIESGPDDALGWKNRPPVLGPLRAQYFDDDGADERGVISNLESTVMKLRSGAAVSPSEAERLAGFIPKVTDKKVVALDKLKKFRAYMETIVARRRAYYEQQGYAVPTMNARDVPFSPGAGQSFGGPADEQAGTADAPATGDLAAEYEAYLAKQGQR